MRKSHTLPNTDSAIAARSLDGAAEYSSSAWYKAQCGLDHARKCHAGYVTQAKEYRLKATRDGKGWAAIENEAARKAMENTNMVTNNATYTNGTGYRMELADSHMGVHTYTITAVPGPSAKRCMGAMVEVEPVATMYMGVRRLSVAVHVYLTDGRTYGATVYSGRHGLGHVFCNGRAVPETQMRDVRAIMDYAGHDAIRTFAIAARGAKDAPCDAVKPDSPAALLSDIQAIGDTLDSAHATVDAAIARLDAAQSELSATVASKPESPAVVEVQGYKVFPRGAVGNAEYRGVEMVARGNDRQFSLTVVRQPTGQYAIGALHDDGKPSDTATNGEWLKWLLSEPVVITGSLPAAMTVQQMERAIAGKIVDSLLSAGYAVTVDDGEESTVRRSRDKVEIVGAMFQCDVDHLYVRHVDSGERGFVHLVYGNSGHDVISDYSINLESALGGISEYAESLCVANDWRPMTDAEVKAHSAHDFSETFDRP